jgi:hypothetical protein
MKIDRNATIKKHFDLVLALTTQLAAHNLSVVNHSYNYLCFGNWEIVVSSGHKERKFLWDGRDFILSVSERMKGNLSQNSQWKNVDEIPLMEIDVGDLFEKVYQLAIK